jgi:cobalt-zinc-cadmium resistance protein CzcA
MAIALGMIIDAAIIIVEKCRPLLTLHCNEETLKQGILEAAQEVGRPIFFVVFVIAIVFLPIFTLGEVEGKMIRPLAFAVVATMAGSLIYALLISPLLFNILHRFDKNCTGHAPGKYLAPMLNLYESLVRKAVIRP